MRKFIFHASYIALGLFVLFYPRTDLTGTKRYVYYGLRIVWDVLNIFRQGISWDALLEIDIFLYHAYELMPFGLPGILRFWTIPLELVWLCLVTHSTYRRFFPLKK